MASGSVGWACTERAMSSERRAVLERDGGLGDEIRRARTEDVHADDAVGTGVGEDLHRARRLTETARARVGLEGTGADREREALSPPPLPR